MLGNAAAGTLESRFGISPKVFGRIEDVIFEEQVRFEGRIFGGVVIAGSSTLGWL